MASSARFSEVEGEKIAEIIDAAIPENRIRQTTWSASIFNGELSKTAFSCKFSWQLSLSQFCKCV